MCAALLSKHSRRLVRWAIAASVIALLMIICAMATQRILFYRQQNLCLLARRDVSVAAIMLLGYLQVHDSLPASDFRDAFSVADNKAYARSAVGDSGVSRLNEAVDPWGVRIHYRRVSPTEAVLYTLGPNHADDHGSGDGIGCRVKEYHVEWLQNADEDR